MCGGHSTTFVRLCVEGSQGGAEGGQGGGEGVVETTVGVSAYWSVGV